MIYRIVVALALVAAAAANYPLYTENTSELKSLWENFKANFQRSYSTMEEETHRFHVFIENLKLSDHRNEQELKNGGSAVHGITKFFDLSQAEFQTNFLTSDPSLKLGEATVDPNLKLGAPDASLGLIDWTGKYTTDVKDQGYCGSCWAFSATEQIETDAIRTLGVTYKLSPEQITQCDTTSSGCNGGWTERAYAYVKKAGGIETEADYPYTSYQGVTGTCKSTSSKFVIGVTGYSTISGESSMASYVQSYGPLSVCLDASTWNSYTGGIVSVCGKSVDHCVQAVGVDASTGGYWKVRNSWGTSWGEAGFIRLAYGKNTCAITNDPTYVSVKKL
jgi:C1A family cysteine protease